jgi:hypothetical protein
MTGGTMTAGTFVNNGSFNYTGGTATVGELSGSGTTSVGSGRTLTADHVRQATFTVTGGDVVINASSLAGGLSVVGSLSITSGGHLDLKDNKLITNNAVGTATSGTYNGVQGLVQSAMNAGAWDGAGITTSESDALSGLTTLGVSTGEIALGLTGSDTALFAGQTVGAGSTLVMYTYAGDANLDGMISGDDFSTLDFNIGVSGASGYYNGDFNYDGIISGDDYSTIDFNFGAQGAPFYSSGGIQSLAVTPVPEPATVAIFALAGIALRRRRIR